MIKYIIRAAATIKKKSGGKGVGKTKPNSNYTPISHLMSIIPETLRFKWKSFLLVNRVYYIPRSPKVLIE